MNSIRFRFTVIIFLLFGTLFLFFGLFVTGHLHKEMQEVLRKRLLSTARVMALEYSGVYADYIIESETGSDFLKTVREKLVRSRDAFTLIEICISDADGKVRISSNPNKRIGSVHDHLGDDGEAAATVKAGRIHSTRVYLEKGEPYMSIFVPALNREGVVRACVSVEASADYFKILRRINRFFFVSAAGLAVLLFLFSYLLSRFITSPILSLSRTASLIGDGELGLQSEVRSSDEVGRLAAALNTMSSRLKVARHELDSRISSLQILAGGVAHEIRNPLLGINLYVDLLRKKHSDPQVTETCSKIKNEIHLIEDIVSRLLDYTRPLKLHKESMRLDEVLRRTVVYTGKSVPIVNSEPNLTVEADRELLLQVFANVFKNAVEAAGELGRVEVVIGRNVSGRSITTIRNSGVPVPAENRARLFEPFFTTKPKGTGLGLAICRKIIEAHNGLITLEDSAEPGFATDVRIIL